MEDIILAEDLLEKIEGLLRQLEGVINSDFTMTEELLHQIKEDLESILSHD